MNLRPGIVTWSVGEAIGRERFDHVVRQDGGLACYETEVVEDDDGNRGELHTREVLVLGASTPWELDRRMDPGERAELELEGEP